MRSVILFLSFAVLISCKSKVAENQPGDLPEDFEVFYEQFHVDSLYQLEHIIFPLEGHVRMMENQLEIINPVTWEKDDWIMHKPFNDYGGTFQRQYLMTGNTVIEKIYDKSSFFKMERRFAKLGGDWTLIYYGANN